MDSNFINWVKQRLTQQANQALLPPVQPFSQTPAIEAPPVKSFVKGFMGKPGEGTNSEDIAQSFGDFLANGTPAGGVDDLFKVGAAVPAVVGGMKIVDRAKDTERAVQEAIPTFEGLKGLTTQVIESLRGSKSVSPQTITNLTKQPQVKNAEKLLLEDVLKKYEGQGKIPVQQFAKDVESELLPLENKPVMQTHYDSIHLPEESRGNVTDYKENIYRSPISNDAGRIHFGFDDEGQNYFAHTRTEDIIPPDSNTVNGRLFASGKLDGGDTRRVIELQSDLFQKGRLDQESLVPVEYAGKEFMETPHFKQKVRVEDYYGSEDYARRNEIEAKLRPFQNTWHERVIREEVKKAAQDGKTKLQFPTGDTAMNIEGLVNRGDKWVTLDNKVVNGTNIKDGDIITYYDSATGAPHEDRRFLVTKNNGDGTFKVVDSLTAENDADLYQYMEKKGLLDDGRMPTLEEMNNVLNHKDMDYITKNYLSRMSEDLSAQDIINKNNPIYKFYESEVGKYLGKKYGAEKIVDPQGVSWWQIPVKPEAGKAPVEAFGLGGIGLGSATLKPKDKEEKKGDLPPIY